MRAAVLALIALAAAARTAAAHQTSIKYVELTIDGTEAHLAFKVAPGDVTEPMVVPADAKPTAEAAAAAAGTPAYVARWLAVVQPDAVPTAQPCAAGPATATADADHFVVVAWTATCPQPIARLVLDFRAFFAVDPRMEAIVRIGRAGGDPDDVDAVVVRAPDSPVVVRAGESSLPRWIRYGMNHIYSGTDHICFVLALLLVVMLRKDERGRWATKSFAQSLRATGAVVTAFTVAHSLTLIAAALGWVSLPSRLVESAIAASIAYTAAENIVRLDVRWRYALTFGFGLAHGLGFASALAAELPPHGVVPPLLCFNVGVELGQLTIVAVALPIFYVACARVLGAERYRRYMMPLLSSIIFVFGTVWFVERALGM